MKIPTITLIAECVTSTADSKLKELGDAKYAELVSWFNKRLDDAIKAAEEEKKEGSAIFSDGERERDIAMGLWECKMELISILKINFNPLFHEFYFTSVFKI